MAAFFLERSPDKTLNDIKIMKLLYIAERTAVELDGVPIALDSYASMKHGPVLSKTYDRMKPTAPVSLWSEYITPISSDGSTVTLQKAIDTSSILRESEIEILEKVWETFGGWTKWELRKYCHDNFREYDKRAENPKDGEPRSYRHSLKDMFVGIGLESDLAERTDSEIRALAN